MITDEYEFLFRNFACAYDTSDSDFSFILRMILNRGAEEANYLAFRSNGKIAVKYNKLRIRLEGLVSDLPALLDRDGNVPRQHRSTLREAVTLSRCLIAIERDQTAGQLDMLDERLKNPRGMGQRLEKAA